MERISTLKYVELRAYLTVTKMKLRYPENQSLKVVVVTMMTKVEMTGEEAEAKDVHQ